MYKITNICLKGNEHGRLKANVIYAELRDEENGLIISSTLEYILAAIRDRGYRVDGVRVSRHRDSRSDVICSEVFLYLLG